METVNHVLDYTKLSGNTKAGGVENVIIPAKYVVLNSLCNRLLISPRVDLMQLVEEAAEGCWIGFRARTPSGGSEIGSVYSPHTPAARPVTTVETVVDISYREQACVRHICLILTYVLSRAGPSSARREAFEEYS